MKDEVKSIHKYTLCWPVDDWADLIEFLWSKGDIGISWAQEILDDIALQMAEERWSITPLGIELARESSAHPAAEDINQKP